MYLFVRWFKHFLESACISLVAITFRHPKILPWARTWLFTEMCSLPKKPVPGAGLERRQVRVSGGLVPGVNLTRVLALLACSFPLTSLTTTTSSVLATASALAAPLTTTTLTSAASTLTELHSRHFRILYEGFVKR